MVIGIGGNVKLEDQQQSAQEALAGVGMRGGDDSLRVVAVRIQSGHWISELWEPGLAAVGDRLRVG